MRLQLVVTVEAVGELHRPRWDDHPTKPQARQLHIGLDGLDGKHVHLILTEEVANDLFELLRPIIASDDT